MNTTGCGWNATITQHIVFLLVLEYRLGLYILLFSKVEIQQRYMFYSAYENELFKKLLDLNIKTKII